MFFVLHGLVMLMKQHSYAFCMFRPRLSIGSMLIHLVDNGHLSEEFKMRAALRNKLKQLDGVAPAVTPSATSPKFSTSLDYLDHRPKASDLNQRRQSRTFTNEDGASNIDQVGAAIESGKPLDLDQIQIFQRIIKWEIGKLISIPTCKFLLESPAPGSFSGAHICLESLVTRVPSPLSKKQSSSY